MTAGGLRAQRASDPPPAAPEAAATPAGWDAALALAYERRGPRTVLARNVHTGPLVVQKPLYPEGEALCHTVILHPPGGIAGGDRLAVDVDAGPGTEVLLTTPGATKWYKANSRTAAQTTHLRVGANAIVEWLPLETIVFDGADARTALSVDIDGPGQVAGWEIVAFGRGAAGERFTRGRFRQAIEIRRAGVLLWAEYGEVGGGDGLLQSAAGYAGRTVSGTLWVCGGNVEDTVLAACRDAARGLPARARAGVTCLPCGVLVARCLCDSTEQARGYLLQVWTLLRPLYAGRAATVPRLWAT
ncbi:MAG: urease accessory protein UreD [Betaproteobacteria bacterium]|nr:urease accessory protein UreD [Betaproteobacteria bacterium]